MKLLEQELTLNPKVPFFWEGSNLWLRQEMGLGQPVLFRAGFGLETEIGSDIRVEATAPSVEQVDTKLRHHMMKMKAALSQALPGKQTLMGMRFAPSPRLLDSVKYTSEIVLLGELAEKEGEECWVAVDLVTDQIARGIKAAKLAGFEDLQSEKFTPSALTLREVEQTEEVTLLRDMVKNESSEYADVLNVVIDQIGRSIEAAKASQ